MPIKTVPRAASTNFDLNVEECAFQLQNSSDSRPKVAIAAVIAENFASFCMVLREFLSKSCKINVFLQESYKIHFSLQTTYQINLFCLKNLTR